MCAVDGVFWLMLLVLLLCVFIVFWVSMCVVGVADVVACCSCLIRCRCCFCNLIVMCDYVGWLFLSVSLCVVVFAVDLCYCW